MRAIQTVLPVLLVSACLALSFAALVIVSAFENSPASAQESLLEEVFVTAEFRDNGTVECKVVKKVEPGQKAIAGPFRSQEEAIKAMKQIPACQGQR